MKIPLEKNCLECKNLFYKGYFRSLKSWNETAKFCSTECHDVWRSKNVRMEKSGNWKLFPSYSAIHKWMHANYGKADRCDNKISNFLGFKCSAKYTNYHWARLHNKPLERNRNNFVMLCISCHTKYDRDSSKEAYTINSPYAEDFKSNI